MLWDIFPCSFLQPIHGSATTSDVTGLPLQVLLVNNHSLSSPCSLLLPVTFWSHYTNLLDFVVVVHLLSWVRLFVTPGTAAPRVSLSFTISQNLLRFMCIESVMPSNHLIFGHPLLLLSVFLSIRVFFPVNQLFASCGQSVGASASASVLPMNIQDWFPLGLTGLISL